MGWPAYLQGVARQDLLNLVATSVEEDEPLVALVGQVVDDMIKHCQWASVNKTGYYVRMEVVRTETRQTKYQPLQPYMDRDSIVGHARPWQQIVAFFVQTRGRERENPGYQFTARQKKAFQALM